jgi:hypothetical protein
VRINREDVVQAALTVERWCRRHWSQDGCDCPLAASECECLCGDISPCDWELEDKLRTRGMKHDD